MLCHGVDPPLLLVRAGIVAELSPISGLLKQPVAAVVDEWVPHSHTSSRHTVLIPVQGNLESSSCFFPFFHCPPRLHRKQE